MLDENYLSSSNVSTMTLNSKKSTLLTNKSQDFGVISLQLTQSPKNVKKEQLLHEAVIKNDIIKVKLLLETDVSINSKIHLDRTPLHWAAMHGYTKIIDILINNGSDLESEDKLGMTSLLVAAWYGHVQAVETLIQNNSSLKSIDKKGQTLLHCAAKNDHFDVIKFLLNNHLDKLNLDAKDKKEQTALHLAIMNDDVDIVNRLIECGASLTIKDKYERMSVHWAAVKGYHEILENLLQNKDKFDLNQRDAESKSPLHLAAEFGHKKCVSILLKHEADYYSTDNEGKTPLHIASSLGYNSTVEVLLSVPNRSIKVREKKGNTALHLAVMGNHYNTVQTLIQNGAPINYINNRQQAPLHIAAEMGFTESAQVLISHDADFTISEKISGRTALYIAARGSFTAIVDMLIKADRSRQSHSFSLYSELSRKCSLERNISLDSTDTHKTYLTTSEGSESPTNHNLQHQLSRQQSEFSQNDFDINSFGPILNSSNKYNSNSNNNSLKINFYNNNTKEMRDILNLIAKHYLDLNDWKKLAKLWQFTDEHIQAIEHQYTGKTSFKEHSHRMMLIWLHSLPPHQNALKELLDSLRLIERKDIAERVRKKIADGEFAVDKTNAAKVNDLSTKLTKIISDDVSEDLKIGHGIVRIVASMVSLSRRRRCECFPASNGSCGYCCIS